MDRSTKMVNADLLQTTQLGPLLAGLPLHQLLTQALHQVQGGFRWPRCEGRCQCDAHMLQIALVRSHHWQSRLHSASSHHNSSRSIKFAGATTSHGHLVLYRPNRYCTAEGPHQLGMRQRPTRRLGHENHGQVLGYEGVCHHRDVSLNALM